MHSKPAMSLTYGKLGVSPPTFSELSCPNTIEPRRTSTANASSTDIPMCSCVFSITITPAYDFQSSVLVCTCTSYVYERHVSANSPCLRLFAEHASTMPINHTCAYYVYVCTSAYTMQASFSTLREKEEKNMRVPRV